MRTGLSLYEWTKTTRKVAGPSIECATGMSRACSESGRRLGECGERCDVNGCACGEKGEDGDMSGMARAENNNYSQGMERAVSFLTWNIEGLYNKLSDNDFVSFVSSFDFVSLTETFIIEDLKFNVFTSHDVFYQPATRLTLHGKPSGGHLLFN